MSKHVLYAYVDASDIAEVSASLEACFANFIISRTWLGDDPWLVNQQHIDGPCSQEADIPLRDLGLNMALPDPGAEFPGWFEDVVAVAIFLGDLHSKTGRDFIIGIADTESGITDDLFGVSSPNPNIDELRAIIGDRESK